MRIPFNKPYFTGREIEYMQDAMKLDKVCGDGEYTKKLNNFIEARFGTKKALFVSSCSSALDMAGLLLNLKPDDEVIMPSFTFTSTANAVTLRGAKVVFADIEPQTMNIDPKEIEEKITLRTKAIFVVHYAGVACDMDRITELAKRNNLKIVEDAAQGVNAKYKDKYLGTIGDIGCYSFHETKNYICGEGGAILINRDEEWVKKAEIIREKGTNRSQFFRGEVDKYSWVEMGSSYLGADILAGFLYAQFEELDSIQDKRRQIFEYYYSNLKALEIAGKIRLPIIPEHCNTNYHMFYLIFQNEKERDKAMQQLKEVGIMAVFHYIPLHVSPMGRAMGYKEGDLPITEEYSNRLLRLPMYADLRQEDQEYIIEKLKRILR